MSDAQECRYCEELALHNQVTCGSKECLDHHVSLQASRAAAAEGEQDGMLGYERGVVELVHLLERELGHHDGFRLRQALAATLWRSLNRQPELGLSASMTLDRVTLKEGGRRIELNLLSLPACSEYRRQRG